MCFCKASGVSQDSAAEWRRFYLDRWGTENELTVEAAKLAGGWKQLYRSKHTLEQADDPWQKPSPFEVSAAIAQLCNQPAQLGMSEVACIFLLDGSGSMNPGKPRLQAVCAPDPRWSLGLRSRSLMAVPCAGDFSTMSSFVIDAAEAISSTHEDAQVKC